MLRILIQSDEIFKTGKKNKCSYMMCNIDPSKVMEINVIVWSCQQKKMSKAATPQKWRDCPPSGKWVLSSSWKPVKNCDKSNGWDVFLWGRVHGGARWHKTPQYRPEIAVNNCALTILSAMLLFNSSFFTLSYLYLHKPQS